MEKFIFYKNFLNKQKKRRALRNEEVFNEELDIAKEFEDENNEVINNLSATLGVLEDKPPRKKRSKNRERETRKLIWEELYHQGSEKEFIEKMRIKRTTLDKILEILRHQLILSPTNMVPNPTSPERQLGLTIYGLAHGVTFNVLEDVFGVSKEAGCVFFNKVFCLLVSMFL